MLAITAGMGRAQAHPLGNFTINHLARLQPERGRLHVHYVLDIAEIPTFQIMHARRGVEPAGACAIGKTQRQRSSPTASRSGQRHRAAAASRSHVGAHASGRRRLADSLLDRRLHAPPSRDARRFRVRDSVYADRRIGWKDIILPGLDRSDRRAALVSERADRFAAPNDAATFDVLGGGRIAHVHVSGDDASCWGCASIVRSSALSDLFARNGQTPLWFS